MIPSFSCVFLAIGLFISAIYPSLATDYERTVSSLQKQPSPSSAQQVVARGTEGLEIVPLQGPRLITADPRSGREYLCEIGVKNGTSKSIKDINVKIIEVRGEPTFHAPQTLLIKHVTIHPTDTNNWPVARCKHFALGEALDARIEISQHGQPYHTVNPKCKFVFQAFGENVKSEPSPFFLGIDSENRPIFEPWNPDRHEGEIAKTYDEWHDRPTLVVQHDKIRDTEPWPDGGGYNVKFRILNDSNAIATNVGARIHSIEYLEGSNWKPYGHDYADIPLETRSRQSKFDLQGGDEESVYIAKRSVRTDEPIQLCYARVGVPNTIPLKPAWRITVRLVSDNAPRMKRDPVFQLRVSTDGSLVGTLLNGNGEDELARRKRKAEYISEIYAEAVDLRENARTLRVLDASTEEKMNELQQLLSNEMFALAPERSINLRTLNVYDVDKHPRMLLQDPKRTLEFSEFLRRVMKILEDYR